MAVGITTVIAAFVAALLTAPALSGWRRYVLLASLALIAMMGCISVYSDKSAEAEQQKNFKTILSDLGDTSATKELIALKTEKLLKLSPADADKWADSLINSIPRRQEAIAEVDGQARPIVNQLRLRWEPIYRFVLDEYDKRADALVKRGVAKVLSSETYDVIEEGRFPTARRVIRSHELSPAFGLLMELEPARIEMGKVIRGAQINLYERFIGYGQKEKVWGSGDIVFVLRLYEKRTQFITDYSAKYTADPPEFESTTDPASDPVLQKLISETLDRAFVVATVPAPRAEPKR